jgi:hypothetical protein
MWGACSVSSLYGLAKLSDLEVYEGGSLDDMTVVRDLEADAVAREGQPDVPVDVAAHHAAKEGLLTSLKPEAVTE